MAAITDLPSAWRQDYAPGSFRGCFFHVDAGIKENGRRIVTHEFPKKEIPYSEDMGKIATAFSVRGYCIQYPFDQAGSTLYVRDYRIPRDLLLGALETEGPGVLKLPLLPQMVVVCPRYRLTEESDKGGYCVFDMTFVEYGQPPVAASASMNAALVAASQILSDRAAAVMDGVTAGP